MTFRQEQDMGRDFYYSITLFEAAISLAPSKEYYGKVPYQKPQLKSMAHGTCTCTCVCTCAHIERNVIVQCSVPTQY